MIRTLLPLTALWLASAAVAQTPPPTAPAPAPTATPVPATTRVTLQTAQGPITIAVETERAPVTAANFLRYVDQKRLDGVAFYRAVKVAPGYGLVQFGTRNDPKRSLKAIAHEATSRTGLSHVDGAISMARAAPGTASGDFFITVGDLPSMDADPSQPGDNQGYAVFGRVVEGMDLVRHLLTEPTSATAGIGAMKGQMLEPTIRITSARRDR